MFVINITIIQSIGIHDCDTLLLGSYTKVFVISIIYDYIIQSIGIYDCDTLLLGSYTKVFVITITIII